jgi:hypothetical protein
MPDDNPITAGHPDENASPTGQGRLSGPVVFGILLLVVGSVGGWIWLATKVERPETKPAVSRDLEPTDWSWARTADDANRQSSDGR